MKFYAATNIYGTSTSLGFSNTWRVLVFSDKKSRDAYVENSSNFSTQAIRRDEIGLYIEAPEPFSGKCRQIFTDPVIAHTDIVGYVGEIVVDWADGGVGKRF